MEKQMMLQALEERIDDYRRSHSPTAEIDIAVFRAFCSGKTAVRIAMDIPCSESTVYRALRRVRKYLSQSVGSDCMESLRKYIAAHPPNFSDGDAESLLEMLYNSYAECNRMDNDEIRADFKALYESMNGMSLREMDQVIYPVCSLCRDHEMAGFTEGVKVGIRLGDELRN